MAQEYTFSDVSIIIPTFNRASDLRETLDSFKPMWPYLKEVLIIDQSTDDETRKLITSLKSPTIRYIRSIIPSLTRARNYGLENLNRKTKIVGFLDDDVTISKGYFEEILKVFNVNPGAKGVSGWYLPEIAIKKYEQLIKKIFRIEHYERNEASVISAYGQVYPSYLDKVIVSEWIPGFNMFFKKEVFNKNLFDEKLERYALGEDFDFSYRVHKAYKRSLFITPFAKITHRASVIERYPTEKAAHMNQMNHIYLNFKNFNETFKEKITFAWTLSGILFLRTIRVAVTRKKVDAVKLFLFCKSLFFCLTHLSKVRNLEN